MIKIKKFPGAYDIDIIKTCTPVIGTPFMKAYFVRVDNVFIDSGNSNCRRSALVKYLKGLPKRDKWLLLNTHLHEDHCGNNGLIQEILDAEILAPSVIDISKEMTLFYRLFWGKPYRFKSSILRGDLITTDTGRKIRVVHTPGHTRCHVSYFIEDEKILILVTGDAVPYPARKVHTILGEDYIRSIDNMKAFRKYADQSVTFLTAHQGILSDPKSTLETRIRNMEDIVSRVLKSWDDSPGDVPGTAEAVLGRPPLLDRLLSSRMSRGNTIRSIVGLSKSIAAETQSTQRFKF